MGKINVARVILGGLLAGLIINISEYVLNTYVIADEAAAVMQRLGLPAIGTNQIAIFVAMTFVLSIVMIFLYAGLRPRFGAGAGTAVIAGLIIWIVGLMSALADVVIGLAPANLLVVAGIWSLVETIVAAIAGAWVYTESA
jgi:hypothetical protein